MRWMNPETFIQSEVKSEREKYPILMYIITFLAGDVFSFANVFLGIFERWLFGKWLYLLHKGHS